jgi:predicted DNA-binding ribbon-helix-helix protein
VSTLSIRLPNSLHKNLKRISEKEGVSINQLIASAVAEKVSALKTESYLQVRVWGVRLESNLRYSASMSDATYEQQYPAVELAYPIAINAYDFGVKRLDVMDARIQTIGAFAVTVSAAFVSVAASPKTPLTGGASTNWVGIKLPS